MISIAKLLFVPGSISWLALMCLASGLLIVSGGRLRRAGSVVLGMTLVTCAMLSTPAVACRLIAHLAVYGRLQRPASVSAVVLLDGDNRPERVQEALRLYRWLEPRWVVVSGDFSLWSDLVRHGVPPGRLLVDSASRTTRQQALHVTSLLGAHDIHRSVLVASEIQMPRAVGAFQATGLDVLPSASPVGWRGPCTGAIAWEPRRSALYASRQAVYEYLALWYYRWRGWIAPAPVPSDRSAHRAACPQGHSPDGRQNKVSPQ